MAVLERQTLLYCALHATNALLQHTHGPLFSAADFDRIAASCQAAENAVRHAFFFPLFSPYKSILGLGSWDITVITRALETRGLRVACLQQSTPPAALAAATGLLLNRVSLTTLGSLLQARHWLSLVVLADGRWYNMDSLLERPVLVGSLQDACTLLAQEPPTSHAFLVTAAV